MQIVHKRMNTVLKWIYNKTFVTKKVYRLIKQRRRQKIIKTINGPVLSIDNFIINKVQEECHEEKIKVRIIYSTQVGWNAIKSLAVAFMKDDKYNLKFILLDISGEDIAKMIRQISSIGVGFYIGNPEIDDYKPEIDCPDIVIATNPWRDNIIQNLRKYAKVIAIVSFTLIDYSSFVKEDFWCFLQRQFREYAPDIYYFDALMYDSLVKTGAPPSLLCKVGNVKYDEIYEVKRGKYNAGRWPKLQGKKVFLYATTHGIKVGEITNEVSFDVYGSFLFELMRNEKRMGLIFRPHPVLINELISTGIWSKADYMKFRRYIENSDNIVYDDSESYNDAYGVCDAILTDAFCGVSVSSLPLMKPIALLYRDNNVRTVNKSVDKALYVIRNKRECKNFLYNVYNNIDPKFNDREKAAKDFICHFDGKNGERMKKSIEDFFTNKLKEANK